MRGRERRREKEGEEKEERKKVRREKTGREGRAHCRIRSDHTAMHSRRRTKRYIIDVSLISMWRTLCHAEDRRQDFTKRFLLAHHLQGCPPFLYEVLIMPSSIKHLQER